MPFWSIMSYLAEPGTSQPCSAVHVVTIDIDPRKGLIIIRDRHRRDRSCRCSKFEVSVSFYEVSHMASPALAINSRQCSQAYTCRTCELQQIDVLAQICGGLLIVFNMSSLRILHRPWISCQRGQGPFSSKPTASTEQRTKACRAVITPANMA